MASRTVAIDDAVAELRSRIGQEMAGPSPYLTEASRDAIRHWAEALGDENPLWVFGIGIPTDWLALSIKAT